MLRGNLVKLVYELYGQGVSIRGIGERLGLSRNTVRKYLRAQEVPRAKPRPPRGSKLAPHYAFVQERLGAGVDNCEVLLRELRQRGYQGGATILKDYVQPLRRPRQPKAAVRFETDPGEQAQIDFGEFRYQTPDGAYRKAYAFVAVLSWSRAIYVEFIPRADLPHFLRCHVHAFQEFGGAPKRCLYDNAKVVVLERDASGDPVYAPAFLDLSRRLGFSIQLCRPYRAQTKGRVERGVGYVEHNFWPGARFADLDDLNRQVREWWTSVANPRLHGTTHERPADRLVIERPHLRAMPEAAKLTAFLRDPRKVGRDGYVQWDGSQYGVSWRLAGTTVMVAAGATVVELWAGEERLAIHPRASHPGQRFTLPGQWEGLAGAEGSARPARGPVAVQLAAVEVQQRPLHEYDALLTASPGRQGTGR